MCIFFGQETRNIEFLWSGGQQYEFFVVQGGKLLIFCGPRTNNIDFLYSLKGFATSWTANSWKKQWKIFISTTQDKAQEKNARFVPPTSEQPVSVQGRVRRGVLDFSVMQFLISSLHLVVTRFVRW